MVSVAIVHKLIYDYRLDFYNELGKKVDLTVVHSGAPKGDKCMYFSEKIVSEVNIGGFYWQAELGGVLKSFDAVIYLFDIRYLSTLMRVVFRSDEGLVLFWGIGYGSSLIGKFVGNRIRTFLSNKVDYTGVYMKQNMEELVSNGVLIEKVFVAPNTIKIKKPNIPKLVDRKHIVFLGSIKPRKGLDILYISFKNILTNIDNDVRLIVVGGGDLAAEKDKVKSLGIYERVDFLGEISCEEKLCKVFSKSVACVSPNQAGLSILTSFALGVPFVTSFNSVSGGERYNIKHCENGLFYDGTDSQLSQVLLFLLNNRDVAHKFGCAANDYYVKEMNQNLLVDSFLKKIESS